MTKLFRSFFLRPKLWPPGTKNGNIFCFFFANDRHHFWNFNYLGNYDILYTILYYYTILKYNRYIIVYTIYYYIYGSLKNTTSQSCDQLRFFALTRL